ncbi:hypothetical protein FPV67DRAFT_1675695 [Lyophyllum atratum]|nr:hypothetical protein FPV67DRAFT_1675695 [Lyophyllum atratum]
MPQIPQLPIGIVINLLRDRRCLDFLHNWSELRETYSEQRRVLQLCQYDDDTKIRDLFEVKKMAGGYRFLQWRDSGDEVVLDVSGLLVSYHLPPITPKSGVNPAERKSLSHSIAIIGPDNPQFTRARSALQRIFSYFAESFAEGDLRGPEAATIGSADAICAQTRFIAPVERNVFETTTISDSIDPHHILSKLVETGKFVYTVDNIINFLEVVRDRDGHWGKDEAFPGIFRKGQLVEASLAFRTVAIGGRHVPLTKIEGLVLVNRIGSQLITAEQESIQRQKDAPQEPTPLLTRKRRHVDDDLDGDMRKRAKENVVHDFSALPGCQEMDAA